METGVFNFQGKLQENGSRVITAANVETDVTINGEPEKGTLIVTTEGENDTPALKLNLELPEGPAGPPGLQGERGLPGKDGETPNVTWNSNDYTLTIKSGDTSITTDSLQGPPGEQGPRGRTPLIKIGTVETVDPGKEAIIIDSNENPSDITLNFKIPRGVRGLQGIQGERGPEGNIGNLKVESNEANNPTSIITNVSYSGETIATKFIGCLPINLGGTGETTLEDIQSTFGISNINTNINAINTNINTINNKINELILVSNTQPQNSNTQIWFDTSNPIGG